MLVPSRSRWPRVRLASAAFRSTALSAPAATCSAMARIRAASSATPCTSVAWAIARSVSSAVVPATSCVEETICSVAEEISSASAAESVAAARIAVTSRVRSRNMRVTPSVTAPPPIRISSSREIARSPPATRSVIAATSPSGRRIARSSQPWMM